MSRPFYETYDPPGIPRTPNYHHAMRAGNTLYVAGQVARDEERRVIAPHDAEAQARVVFEHIARILAAAGADWSHVVKVTTFLVDREDSAAVSRVRLEAQGEHRPPHTGLIIAGLGHEAVRLEVEVIAVLPE